jgi:anti-sigma factor RsiW
MPLRDLSCRELTDFIYAYEEGELPGDDRAAFDAHLAECPDCVAYLAGYRRSVSLGKQAFEGPDEPAPDDVPADLIRAVLAARRRQRPG